MTTTENYSLKIAEGGDLVNPLVIDNPNYETIDEVMKANADNGIPKATELTTGTVHALTRSNPDASVFHFTATSNFTTGDTFTVDNTQVTALLPSGLPLATGAYIIGSEVICALRDTLLTVFVSGGTAVMAEDSQKFGGELPSYYATQEDMTSAEGNIDALGTITSNLDTRVTALEQGSGGEYISIAADGIKTVKQILDTLYAQIDMSKVTKNSVLLVGTLTTGSFYHLSYKLATRLSYSSVRVGGASNIVANYYTVSATSYAYEGSVTNATVVTDLSNTVPASGERYTIYY